MYPINVLYSFLLLVVASSSMAQGSAQITGLRGIELGSELKTNDRQECPKEAGKYVFPVGSNFRTRMGDRQCWASMTDFSLQLSTPLFAAFQIHNVSEIRGMLPTVGTALIDGRIEAMESLFGRDAYSAIRDALVQRYGPFDKEESISFQYRSGAKIVGKRATWDREGTILRVDEQLESTSTASVSVYSKKWLDAKVNIKKELSEAAKNKL